MRCLPLGCLPFGGLSNNGRPLFVCLYLALSLLVLSIRDPEKWGSTFDLITSLLKDPAQDLVRSVQSKLLPPFALWSLQLGRLESGIMIKVLEDLDQHCDLTRGLDDQSPG